MMSRTHGALAAALAAGVLGLVGCAGQSSQLSFDGDREAGPVTRGTESWAEQRMHEGLRGLRIQDGLVTIDAREAAKLQKGLTKADAAQALSRGASLYAENDFPGAVGEFRTAILADTSLADGYVGLGDASIGEKEDTLALAAYRTATRLAPNDTAIGMKLAETLNRTGDLAGWTAELERLLAIDPAQGEAHARLAVAKYYAGDREGALAQIRLADQFGGNVPPQLRDMLNH
ncbi:MAG: hypothetical protein IPJ41_16465 [Phycisphaerales bacterium]|nr:hypothetical protein [Phycisphaerales bacterium]